MTKWSCPEVTQGFTRRWVVRQAGVAAGELLGVLVLFVPLDPGQKVLEVGLGELPFERPSGVVVAPFEGDEPVFDLVKAGEIVGRDYFSLHDGEEDLHLVCEGADIADVVTLYGVTGLRRSQMLGLLWSDIDLDECTLCPTGKVIRVAGVGLVRVTGDDDPKNHTGTMALPEFAVAMLKRRKAAMAARRLASPSESGIEDLDLVSRRRYGRCAIRKTSAMYGSASGKPSG